MLQSRSMARFAAQARYRVIRTKLVFGGRRCEVTAKALPDHHRGGQSTRCRFQRSRIHVSSRSGQPIFPCVKAQLAFIEARMIAVKISLPESPVANCPEQVLSGRMRPIAHGKRCFAVWSQKLVTVRAEIRGELRMRLQLLRFGRTCRRSSHRRSDLGCELFCVARRACLAANVLSFLCVPRGWPHGTDSTRISVGMEASALDPRDFDPDERPLAADSAITKVSRTNRPGAILRNGISLRPNTRNQAYGSTLFWSSFG